MDFTFTDIEEDDFLLLYAFIASYQQMGDPTAPDKQLARKLYNQLTPIARDVLGKEYASFLHDLKWIKEGFKDLDIVLQKKYPGKGPTS